MRFSSSSLRTTGESSNPSVSDAIGIPASEPGPAGAGTADSSAGRCTYPTGGGGGGVGDGGAACGGTGEA